MTLYGYFYCSCIYESADGLQSLHHTKAGAWRAMRKARVADCERERNDALTLGKKYAVYQDRYVRYFVHPVEVMP